MHAALTLRLEPGVLNPGGAGLRKLRWVRRVAGSVAMFARSTTAPSITSCATRCTRTQRTTKANGRPHDRARRWRLEPVRRAPFPRSPVHGRSMPVGVTRNAGACRNTMGSVTIRSFLRKRLLSVRHHEPPSDSCRSRVACPDFGTMSYSSSNFAAVQSAACRNATQCPLAAICDMPSQQSLSVRARPRRWIPHEVISVAFRVVRQKATTACGDEPGRFMSTGGVDAWRTGRRVLPTDTGCAIGCFTRAGSLVPPLPRSPVPRHCFPFPLCTPRAERSG